MRAKVTTSFSGKPDEEFLARTIAVDEIIEGDLAGVAVNEGWAIDLDAPKARKAKTPPVEPPAAGAPGEPPAGAPGDPPAGTPVETPPDPPAA